MKPDWCPDWLMTAAYPNKATPLQWAWEFLRRNAQYQKMWEKLIKPNYNPAALDAASNRRSPGRRTRLRMDDTPTVADKFKQEFHVATSPPPPPAEPKAKLLFDTQYIQYEANPTRGASGRVYGEMKARQAVLWFNLDWPIAPQLANANNLLLTLENSQRQFRIREDNYRAYLRVLDAKAAGAKLKKIAEELYPKLPAGSGLQRVRDDLKAAERLRDYDFWLIAVNRQK